MRLYNPLTLFFFFFLRFVNIKEREMAKDSCLARITAGVAVGGAVGGAVGINFLFFFLPKT